MLQLCFQTDVRDELRAPSSDGDEELLHPEFICTSETPVSSFCFVFFAVFFTMIGNTVGTRAEVVVAEQNHDRPPMSCEGLLIVCL